MLIKALAFFVFSFSCVLVQSAIGCPMCNIYNYLAENVRQASDVYVGEVVREVDSREAEVKVVRVFRGAHRAGSTVIREMFRADRVIGREFHILRRRSRAAQF